MIAASAAEAVLDHVEPGADIVVPLANGEPVALLDALEEHHTRLDGVRIHQMHALHERPYIRGECGDHLRHVSYFLSPATRQAYWDGCVDLVPANFSEMPRMLREHTRCSLVLAAASRPDQHGYFTLGTNADYVSPLIGLVPIFLEVTPHMPRTFGLNQIHESQIVGWTEGDHTLVDVPPITPDARDEAIAEIIAAEVPDGATLQVGIGGVPNALLARLRDHRHLGVNTELVSDGIVDLVERGVVTGTRKRLRPNAGSTTGSTTTARSSCCRWTSSTTRGGSRWRSTSSRSTRPPRSTSTASARPRRSRGATGRRAAARPTSRAARCTRSAARRSSSCTRRRRRGAAGSARG